MQEADGSPNRYEADLALARVERGECTAEDAELLRRFIQQLNDVIMYQAKRINQLNELLHE